MSYHYQSNWLGEPERVRIEPDPDETYERRRDEIEVQDAIDRAQQLKLFPARERIQQKEGVA